LCIIMVTASGVQALASPQTVSPTESTVIVNGTPMEFEAYLIGGSNFFRLRDLAYALNGTNKQFSVDWDAAANAILLTGGQPYEPIGGEMALGDGTSQTAMRTTSSIIINDVTLNLTAYNIGGSNFFMLRDIMRSFDIGVAWDAATSTIAIDTNTVYHGYELPTSDVSPRVADRINIVRILEWQLDNGDVWVFPTPRETSITAQEAAEIVVLALEQYFDTDLTGLTLYMQYSDPTAGVEPSAWLIDIPPYGATSINNVSNASNAYSARIMAETGELFSLGRHIRAEETINNLQAVEVGPQGLWPVNLTEAQTTVFANAAMNVAYERGMIEGEVTRAAVMNQWGLMWGVERVPSVNVRVQNYNGDEIVVSLINSEDYGIVVAGIGFDGSFNTEDGGPMLFSWVYR